MTKLARPAGITGYGVYIPEYRLSAHEIWETWAHRTDPAGLKAMTGLTEIAVDSWHDDANTMASDAGKAALEMAGVDPEMIQAIYLGTCTNPYVTKGSVTIVAESLALPAQLFCADVQFGAKSGTSSMQICAALVASGLIDRAIAIGSDTLSSCTSPNDWPGEYSASTGAAAFVLGTEALIATIDGLSGYATETTDFFRLDGDRYITRALQAPEEFIGYQHHVGQAIKGYLENYQAVPEDFDYLALHQRNSKEPVTLAQEAGFRKEQVQPGIIADRIGDTGSACTMIALARILDIAKPGDRILVASYGHGAGSDVLGLTVTDLIGEARKRRVNYPDVEKQIGTRTPISYRDYLRMQRKIIQEYV